MIAALTAEHVDSHALPAVDSALIVYADKVSLAPAAISREDVDALRAVGLADRAIHDTCAIVGYFAFANRIAEGLGVEIEERFGRYETP